VSFAAMSRVLYAGAILGLVLTAPLRARVSVQITSPASGTVVHMGQTLNVTVSVTGGPVSGVTIMGKLIAIQPIQTSSPYQFTVTVASLDATPGASDLGALAGVPGGQPVYSNPIILDLERPDPPVSIRVQESSLDFDRLGETNTLLVIGTYADGSVLNLTASSLTTYSVISASPTAPVTVTPFGQVTSVAVGTGRISVNGTVLIPFNVHSSVAVQPHN
jgi:hypothetical protein